MSKTPIEWTDFSINPFRARNKETGKCGHFCVKISGGCKFCYSSRLQPRFGTFPFLAENRDKVELFLDRSKLQDVIRRRVPTKYFWCDMTDMFLEDYPEEWIDECFAAMALTPQHTHQVLTKRIDRALNYLGTRRRAQAIERCIYKWHESQKDTGYRLSNRLPIHPLTIGNELGNLLYHPRWPLSNVWLGVSVEDRKNKERIDLLRQTPAAVRFLSIEPLIENLGELDLRGIHWVIAGGESGPGARPMHPDWPRSIRDQCQAAGVPFFFKQWGEYVPTRAGEGKNDVLVADGREGRLMEPGLRMVQGCVMKRIGKKRAGARLDGREWREFPEVCS